MAKAKLREQKQKESDTPGKKDQTA